jgi:MYXO-CTERM domain-containing protein
VFTYTTFGSGNIQISEAGDVFWVGDWNDPDTAKDIGIFMNDQLLVQEGVTLVDGVVLATIANVEDNFKISPNGAWLMFEGILADGRDGAFIVSVPEPASVTAVLALGGLALRRTRRRR